MPAVRYERVAPIGDTDPENLPVPDIDAVLPWYTQQFGFRLDERLDTPVARVTLVRDGVRIGLAENGGDPEQASCYIAVNDVEAARAELEAAGMAPTPIRDDQYGGHRYRVFFVRDGAGLCYCLGCKA